MPSWFNNVVSYFANDGVSADELQANSDRLDALKAEQDRRTAARLRNELDEETAAEWEREVEFNRTRPGNTTGLNVNAELDTAYDEGLAEGQANLTSAVRGPFNVAGKALTGILAGIPVWVWLLALGALFIYVGGPGYVAKQLKGK